MGKERNGETLHPDPQAPGRIRKGTSPGEGTQFLSDQWRGQLPTAYVLYVPLGFIIQKSILKLSYSFEWSYSGLFGVTLQPMSDFF